MLVEFKVSRVAVMKGDKKEISREDIKQLDGVIVPICDGSVELQLDIVGIEDMMDFSIQDGIYGAVRLGREITIFADAGDGNYVVVASELVSQLVPTWFMEIVDEIEYLVTYDLGNLKETV